MAHLTANFTSEAALSPAVIEGIAAALSQGWADPKKLSQASHKALELKHAALAEIAGHLGISPNLMEVLGEPSLTHFIAIGGFLQPNKRFIYSAIDQGKIRALAGSHSGESRVAPVTPDGRIEFPAAGISADDVISIQGTNGETGVVQQLDIWRNHPGAVILDATRTIPTAGLTAGFAAATFDAAAWGGPAGIGFVVINESSKFRYPLPHIAPIRVPGSYSLPLLVGSAIALGEMAGNSARIFSLRNYLSQKLASIPKIRVVSHEQDHQSRYLSIVFDDFSGEEVLRALMKRGINTDSGSACSPEDLAPSHVLAAMGYPTTGTLRLTLNAQHAEEDIDLITADLRSVLESLHS